MGSIPHAYSRFLLTSSPSFSGLWYNGLKMHVGSKKESILPNDLEYEDCKTTAVGNHSIEKNEIKELERMKTSLLNSPIPGTTTNRGQPL